MKKGFTLAEVLITLGIIGVVAALTLPTLTSNTQTAKIGPKLAKAASTFEQANEAYLNAESVDALHDLYSFVPSDCGSYVSNLKNHIKAVSGADNCSLVTPDGVEYKVYFPATSKSGKYPHHIPVGQLTIDINTANVKPNRDAEDKFYFQIFDDGSLRPMGGKEWNGNSNAITWETTCKENVKPSANDAKYCAGHIFENNLKVLYK